jgi:hypothetical protein
MIANTNRLSEICGWLKGGGEVTFANRRTVFYKARIINQFSFEKILRGNPHCSFAVNFRCQPFLYRKNVAAVEFTSSGGAYRTVQRLVGAGHYRLWKRRNLPHDWLDRRGTDRRLREYTLDTPLMEAYSGFRARIAV